MEEKYFEYPDFDEKELIEKEVTQFFNDLVSLYEDLQNKYDDLNVALDEASMSKDADIDSYVLAMLKLSHLSTKIPELIDKETELFLDNIILIPYLEKFIKDLYGIPNQAKFGSFSIFDTYIRSEYAPIKENFIIMRIIRAMRYYTSYIEQQDYLQSIGVDFSDSETIKDCIMYDYTDIETLNTLNVIGGTFENVLADELYNKYKCLFSFTNPTIERFFLNADFTEDHPFIFCEFNEKTIKVFKNKIIRSMIAIQRNKIINQDDKSKEIINSNLTFKQIINILFHFNRDTSKYYYRLDMLKHDYSDNVEEVGLLFTYLQQAYLSLDEQSINDLDHLFSVMTKKENNVKMGSAVLHQKLVEHFFNKEMILEQNGYQRTKKKLSGNEDGKSEKSE